MVCLNFFTAFSLIMSPKRKQNDPKTVTSKKKARQAKMEAEKETGETFKTLPITLLSGFLVGDPGHAAYNED